MNRTIPSSHSLGKVWLSIGEGRGQAAKAASVLLFLAAFAGNGARAEYQPGAYRHVPEPEKNSGDITSAEICERGEYVVGFTGRAGAWIDRIGILCAPLLSSGGMGNPRGTQGHGMGGGGGAEVGNGPTCQVSPIIQIIFHTTNGYRMIRDLEGTCGPEGGHALATVGMGGGGSSRDLGDPYFHRCPNGMAATGLGVRFGKDVNAIGLICDKLIMPSRMLFCQGGGMAVSSGPLKLSIFIDFKAAPQSSRAAIPARGECAWQDSPVAPNEPKRLYVPIKNEMKPLVEAAQKGGIFLIHASVQGATIRVDKIDSVNVGFVPGGP